MYLASSTETRGPKQKLRMRTQLLMVTDALASPALKNARVESDKLTAM